MPNTIKIICYRGSKYYFEDFLSTHKIGICKSGLKPSLLTGLEEINLPGLKNLVGKIVNDTKRKKLSNSKFH